VLKDWHKEDIFRALNDRGWSGPFPLDTVSRVVGESYLFVCGEESLNLFFVADMGTGLQGKKSIEAVWAQTKLSKERYELWLHRKKDAKWKKELHDWAEEVSSTVKGTH